MKSIELTEEHKSKLLQMCNKLFPNNKVDSLQFGTIKFLINYYERKDPNNSKLTFGGWDEVVEIHWFEFCMTHLCVKIYNLIDEYNNDLFINMFHGSILSFTHFKESGDFVAIHPVDYLYSEFKKLK